MSVANQKIIKITKEKCSKDNLYTATNLEVLQDAMRDLKGETFKMWMYLSKNKNGYQLELSQKDAEQWGIKKDAYYAGVKALIEKHYLNLELIQMLQREKFVVMNGQKLIMKK